MGYDSKLFIVEKSSFHVVGEKDYASFIASYDLAVFPQISSFMRSCPKADCYVYMDDGNTQILKDRYGAELTQASILDVIKVLEEAKNGKDGNYRRIDPILSMLKTLQRQQEEGYWRDLVVLHFGH